ncbi:hypothetical protein GCM10023096_11990 [Nonomuraea ferruginea]
MNSSTLNGAAACATCGDKDINSPDRAATKAGNRRDLRMKDLLGGAGNGSESEGGREASRLATDPLSLLIQSWETGPVHLSGECPSITAGQRAEGRYRTRFHSAG